MKNEENNETFTKEEQNKIKELKGEVQEIKKKYIAIRILEKEKEEGVEKAVKYSGLPEVEVLRLNHKLLEKRKEIEEKREENNDGEEPKI